MYYMVLAVEMATSQGSIIGGVDTGNKSTHILLKYTHYGFKNAIKTYSYYLQYFPSLFNRLCFFYKII